MKHHFKTLIINLTIVVGLVIPTFLGTTSVSASTGYRRTKTTAVSHIDYYSTNTKAATYSANGSTKNFKFKINHYLKNYKNSTWTRTSKTYITKKGKRYLYYYVHNSKNNAAGWVWNGYLKAGKDYKLTNVKSTWLTYYYAKKDKVGKLYTFGNYSLLSFSKSIPLTVYQEYTKSKQAYVYKKGVKYIYYYLTGINGKPIGWTWRGYLTNDNGGGTTHYECCWSTKRSWKRIYLFSMVILG